MKYHISNTASKKALTDFTKIPLKYPELYQQKYVITGQEETIVPIITQGNQKEISFGIWGLLPNNYEEDWSKFQYLIDSLTIKHNELQNNIFINQISNIKRCLILVTGFFTTYLKEGKTYQYYISAKDKHPFYLAGYYNKLDDGFITFTLLLKKQNKIIQQYQNLTTYMPTIIDSNSKNIWLSDDITIDELNEFIHKPSKLPLNIEQVKNNLQYS